MKAMSAIDKTVSLEPQAEKETNSPSARPINVKVIIIGGSLTLLIISMIALGLSTFILSSPLSVCEEIRRAKATGVDHLYGPHHWLEVNKCRVSESTCTFDTDSCESECPLGYETDANNCPISCDCIANTRGAFQGDIQVNEDEVDTFLSQYGYMSRSADFALFGDSSIEASQRLLFDLAPDSPDKKIIRYYIEDDIDQETRDTIIGVMKKIHDILPCADMRELEKQFANADITRMQFTKKSGCWSGLGKHGAVNEISLGIGCSDESTILHMVYHRLGFHHEHSRPDRDETVTIVYENIKKSRNYQFKKLRKDKTRNTNSRYDLSSIVQLDGMVFSNNEKPTIIVKTTGNAVKADPQDFSTEDARELKYVYCESDEANVETVRTKSLARDAAPGGYPPPSGYPAPGVIYTPSGYPFPLPDDPKSRSTSNDECNGSGWGSWGPYGPCSVTCGQGYKKTNRRCAEGTNACPGSTTMETICRKPTCSPGSSSSPYSLYGSSSSSSWGPSSPFNPYPWSDPETPSSFYPWGSTLPSSSSFQPHQRPPSPWGSSTYYDTSPGQRPGGFRSRAGRATGWSQWGPYGQCEKSCGASLKQRKRSCHPGPPCQGRSATYQICSEPPC